MIFTETGMSGEEIQDTTDFFISYSARKLGLSDHDAWAWMLMPLPILAGCSPCSLVSSANGDILIFLIDAMEKKDEMEIQKVGAYFGDYPLLDSIWHIGRRWALTLPAVRLGLVWAFWGIVTSVVVCLRSSSLEAGTILVDVPMPAKAGIAQPPKDVGVFEIAHKEQFTGGIEFRNLDSIKTDSHRGFDYGQIWKAFRERLVARLSGGRLSAWELNPFTNKPPHSAISFTRVENNNIGLNPGLENRWYWNLIHDVGPLKSDMAFGRILNHSFCESGALLRCTSRDFGSSGGSSGFCRRISSGLSGSNSAPRGKECEYHREEIENRLGAISPPFPRSPLWFFFLALSAFYIIGKSVDAIMRSRWVVAVLLGVFGSLLCALSLSATM